MDIIRLVAEAAPGGCRTSLPAPDPRGMSGPVPWPRVDRSMKLKLDWFLTGMALAIGLAWLMPDPGGKGGALHPELLNKAGVALIFFLNGLGLSFAALKAGTLRWPLHLLVQTSTFVLFPLLGLLALWAAGDHLPADLPPSRYKTRLPLAGQSRRCNRCARQ